MEMSSIKEAKRDLITLDLLGGVSPAAAGAKDVAAVSLKAPSLGCHHPLLRPLDLNQSPEDVVRRKQAAGLFAGGGQSVCTIEQVKRALERAGRESQGERRLSVAAEVEISVASPSMGSASSTSTSSSITTASAKRRTSGVEDAGGSFLVAAGCSGCLSYVLIEKDSLRCPRCESQAVAAATTALTPPAKRPRVDLEFKMGL
ncbi:uncharacterized protein LOC141814004 [Curcuma longa]|uniref:uncharacterized protein LOC141814004 n=1 Tax=Curcuma longa TaxID=136217 RepID=UPI003D9E491A